MKVITWNVNSMRMRLARAKALVGRHQPDVLCLQELKMAEEAFPAEGCASLGYCSAVSAMQAGTAWPSCPRSC